MRSISRLFPLVVAAVAIACGRSEQSDAVPPIPVVHSLVSRFDEVTIRRESEAMNAEVLSMFDSAGNRSDCRYVQLIWRCEEAVSRMSDAITAKTKW